MHISLTYWPHVVCNILLSPAFMFTYFILFRQSCSRFVAVGFYVTPLRADIKWKTGPDGAIR